MFSAGALFYQKQHYKTLEMSGRNSDGKAKSQSGTPHTKYLSLN